MKQQLETAIQQIEEIKKILAEMQKLMFTEQTKPVEPVKVDYSKFIGRCDVHLAIRGQKYLKSRLMANVIEIEYSQLNKEQYNDPLNSEIVDVKDLKYGDVVCYYPDKKESDLSVYRDFGIYMGDNYFTGLHFESGVETPDRVGVSSINKVVRFLRS